MQRDDNITFKTAKRDGVTEGAHTKNFPGWGISLILQWNDWCINQSSLEEKNQQNKNIYRIDSHNYEGEQVPRLAVSKLESQYTLQLYTVPVPG